MGRELVSDPDSGSLGSRTVFDPGVRNVGFVQYRDSVASLREYARDGDRSRLPAWQDYDQTGTKEDAAVGVWHETDVVRPDEFETVYNNMPPTDSPPARTRRSCRPRTSATPLPAGWDTPTGPTHCPRPYSPSDALGSNPSLELL
jgi:hypothetical protein